MESEEINLAEICRQNDLELLTRTMNSLPLDGLRTYIDENLTKDVRMLFEFHILRDTLVSFRPKKPP